MTVLPYSCQPLALWTETTMNLNSKLKQGWLQLLLNEKQLFSTTRNVNNVVQIKGTMKQNLKCQQRNRKHAEFQPARMRKGEQAIKDLLSCMRDFEAEPFDDSNPTLRSLQSGMVASLKFVQVFKTALQDGHTQPQAILLERMFTKTKTLSTTIHKNETKFCW